MSFEKINTIQSAYAATAVEHIDTDQIIPARFLKSTSREGFGEAMFRDWRFDSNGSPIKNSVFATTVPGAKILVAGRNFGCGSSREHAAWALSDYGFRAVVSSFFADIFRNNALNNGLLPVQVSESFLRRVLKAGEQDRATELKIDLQQKTIELLDGSGLKESFPIGAYKQHCLLNGLEDIDYLIENRLRIEQYEQNRNKRQGV